MVQTFWIFWPSINNQTFDEFRNTSIPTFTQTRVDYVYAGITQTIDTIPPVRKVITNGKAYCLFVDDGTKFKGTPLQSFRIIPFGDFRQGGTPGIWHNNSGY